MRFLVVLLLGWPGLADNLVCVRCHPAEVKGYLQFSMAHSLRRADREPAGELENKAGTKFTIYANAGATWQRMEEAGERSDYRVDYVVGSGNHAFGYLIRIGDHLFQSPISYYASRRAYGLAPGYENVRNPDFTRPVTVECLLCHSGKPLHLPGTINRYEQPAFAEEAISCERCHGPSEEHLRRPVSGSIINPARLKSASRDSICEQCHLAGVIRILNPGKQFEDFRPGEPLEDVYTVYRFAVPPGSLPGAFKVISHSEQLAASMCARNSNGKLWCGTCHDPHNKPVQPAVYYRDRCLSCHAGKLSPTHASTNGNCISCHMPRREVVDGGHTVFTDHRIMRKPVVDSQSPHGADLAAWREPPSEFAVRNLALAYINAGAERNSPAWIVRGYRMLTEIQATFPRDIAVLRGFGTALLMGNQPQEAKIAFDRVLRLGPADPVNEENAGRAELASGNMEAAEVHLERALTLDPLLLSTAELLEGIYAKQGNTTKQAAVGERVRQAMETSTALPNKP